MAGARGRCVISPGATKDPPWREANAQLTSQVYRPPFGIVSKFEETLPAQVSYSLLYHGSKLRGPLPITFMFRHSVTGYWRPNIVNLNHGQVTWTKPELTAPSPNFYTTPTGVRLSHDRFNVHQPPLHGGSSVALGSNS
ncbi:hypothetical protein TNCV_4405671 [Trichonephila clavipes]|uniref:Uncharacterized protein n=1 Tax=Trichonephila clavipes TaxID=2585209 RepID=A0A8X6V5T0_TRICX|nr:hypothetical protein TNCV_4405671 [Trichonephila clavipes]